MRTDPSATTLALVLALGAALLALAPVWAQRRPQPVARRAAVALHIHAAHIGQEARIVLEVAHQSEHALGQVRHVPFEEQVRHGARAA